MLSTDDVIVAGFISQVETVVEGRPGAEFSGLLAVCRS